MDKKILLKPKTYTQLVLRLLIIDVLFLSNLIVFSLVVGSMPQDVEIQTESIPLILYVVFMIPLFLILCASSFFVVRIIDNNKQRFYCLGVLDLILKGCFLVIMLVLTAFSTVLVRCVIELPIALLWVFLEVLLLTNKKHDSEVFYIDRHKVYASSISKVDEKTKKPSSDNGVESVFCCTDSINNCDSAMVSSDNVLNKQSKRINKKLIVTLLICIVPLDILLQNMVHFVGIYYYIWGVKIDVIFTVASIVLVVAHGLVTISCIIKYDNCNTVKILAIVVAVIFYSLIHPLLVEVIWWILAFVFYNLIVLYGMRDFRRMYFLGELQ